MESEIIEFLVGGERFALYLADVFEVVKPPTISPVPFTPDYIVGIFNLRGQVLTLLDLAKKLGIESRPSSEQAVVIFEYEDYRIGMQVDHLDKVSTVGSDELQACKNDGESKYSFVRGTIRSGSQMTMILDLKAFVDDVELKQINDHFSRSEVA